MSSRPSSNTANSPTGPGADDRDVGGDHLAHPGPQPCLAGVVTTRPSSASLTLIWQESRELGRTSKAKSSMSSSICEGLPTASVQRRRHRRGRSRRRRRRRIRPRCPGSSCAAPSPSPSSRPAASTVRASPAASMKVIFVIGPMESSQSGSAREDASSRPAAAFIDASGRTPKGRPCIAMAGKPSPGASTASSRSGHKS